MGLSIEARCDTAFRILDEVDEFNDFWELLVGFLYFRDGVESCEPLEEIGFDCGTDGISGCFVPAGSSKSDDIGALDLVPLEEAEVGDVLEDGISAADHGESSDSDELVYHDAGGDECVVADSNVSCEEGRVGDDGAFADDGVMSHV